VHYVSGMTDRFALRLGVELLGWRADDLPRGV
jgi:dGTP triphosphohydrolase